MISVALNNHGSVYRSCSIHIVLFIIFFIISISTGSVFTYFHWYLKSDTNITNININTETVIY